MGGHRSLSALTPWIRPGLLNTLLGLAILYSTIIVFMWQVAPYLPKVHPIFELQAQGP